jgi:Bacterial capsule synthesis protein PGA_cap
MGALALPSPAGRAAQSAQAADTLDAPLLAANMCGAGDQGDVHFTIAATGDTFPHEPIQAVGEAQGYDYLFDHIRPFLKAADLAYTNFDGAMLEGSPYTGYPAFNYNPKLATALKNAGIGLVSSANNHILDRGPEGLDATLNVLGQNGIQQHGAIPSAAAGQARPPYLPITLSRGGTSIEVAFLAFTWGTNGIPDPYDQVGLLWRSNEYGQQGGIRQSALDAIAQARHESDLVIVAAHWGYEYQFSPDASQIEGARQLAAAGADIILGAQSHTLQPVDIIDTGGRKTLVIYSLANFLAAQGAFQDAYFSATAVIFYIGVVRQADGQVRVTGYRYLPTIHVDDDTRPAPLPPQGFDQVLEHVRSEMRDPGGLRQLGPDPTTLGPRVEVCPAYTAPGAPEQHIGGDFAQYFASGGSGTTPHTPREALAVIGLPLGPVVQELSGDCRTSTSVLYTERQRLELHTEASWPFRVVGTQIGVEAYRQKYKPGELQRRTNLEGDAIGDERFKRFYQAYGGLPVFGYPISGLLAEADAATGQPLTVQYFERARFELAPGARPDAELLEQVRLGALGREYPGIAAQCGLPPTTAPVSVSQSPPVDSQARQGLAPAAGTAPRAGGGWWIWAAIVLVGLLLAGAAVRDAHRRRLIRQRRVERRRQFGRHRRRTAERLGGGQILARQQLHEDDDDLLRRLLGD